MYCTTNIEDVLKDFFVVNITSGAMNSSRYKKQVEQAMKTKHTHTHKEMIVNFDNAI